MPDGNLFEDVAPPSEGERFEPLLKHGNLVIERIVSSASASSTEYVQAQDEWVLLVRGEATLEVNDKPTMLHAGDYVFLESGTPHKVTYTSEGALWLAVHLHQAWQR